MSIRRRTTDPPRSSKRGSLAQPSRSPLFGASGFAGYETNFFISINGRDMPCSPLAAGPNFITYGADISAFAGQTAELRFTSRPSPSSLFTTVFLDDIHFSNLAIPQPAIGSLLFLGALIRGW